jgi:hypothetical protein
LNELQRQAYLGAMGVDVYYPRLQLVGAKPSLQCEMPVLPEVTAPSVVKSAQDDTSRVERLTSVSELLDIAVKHDSVVEPKAATATTTAPPEQTPSFNLSVTVIQGSLLVVDDCDPGQLHSRDYQVLLQNIVNALGLGQQVINSQSFQWPEAMKGHNDHSPAAAGQALQAYLARQLELGETRYLLIMGDAARRFAVNTELADGVLAPHDGDQAVQQLLTLSACRMLSEPELKRDLWQQLQSLYRAINDA